MTVRTLTPGARYMFCLPSPMLTPEQQETHALVRRALGDAMADRYEDWCDLTSGRNSAHSPAAAEFAGETDSPAEGDGFEPLIPP